MFFHRKETKEEKKNQLWIRITNYTKLNEMVNPFLLGSLKAKAEVEGITNIINWEHLEIQAKEFETRIALSLEQFPYKFLRKLNRLL